MRIPITVFAAFALCFFATASAAEVSMQKVELYQGLVTLELPSDWHEIPTDLLEYYALESAEARGGRMAELYQHGFRPGDPENDFELPQILIQIRESGRLKYGQFLHLPSIDAMRHQGEVTLLERAESSIRDVRVNEVFFDRENYSIHIHNTLDFKAAGKAIVTQFRSSPNAVCSQSIATLTCPRTSMQRQSSSGCSRVWRSTSRFAIDLAWATACRRNRPLLPTPSRRSWRSRFLPF